MKCFHYVIPGNHKSIPLSKGSFVCGSYIFFNIAIFGVGKAVHLVMCVITWEDWFPETLMTATPLFTHPKTSIRNEIMVYVEY